MEKRMPRRLYIPSDIRKHFELEYSTLKRIFDYGGSADVTANNGKKYHAKYNSGKMDGLGWNGFIELKLIKETK